MDELLRLIGYACFVSAGVVACLEIYWTIQHITMKED